MTEKDMAQAREVAKAYERVIRGIGGSAFISVKAPHPAQKNFANALWVYGWCRENKIFLDAYFKEVLRLYSGDWMEKVFGRAWLPFGVAVSQKTWAKARKCFGSSLGREAEIESARNILLGYPPALRKLMLIHSMGWLSAETKEALRGDNHA